MLSNSKAFSVTGLMVFSSLSLILILGLSKMLLDMRTDMTQLKKGSSNQKALVHQLNALFPKSGRECGDSLVNSIGEISVNGETKSLWTLLLEIGQGTKGPDSIPQFYTLKDNSSPPSPPRGGRTILEISPTNEEKNKRLYGLEGHSAFKLKCVDSDCECALVDGEGKVDCTEPNSNSKKYSLSLFTMSYKNNLPIYKVVWKRDLNLSYDIPLGGQTGEANTPDCISISRTNNTFFGPGAGRNITTGSNNSFFGSQAGYHTTTGKDNSFFGFQAGYHNTTASENSFFGSQAGYKNKTGSENAFFGFQAGYNNTTGSHNSFLGFKAGHGNTTGEYNVFLGANAGSATTTESNRLNIANIIYGTASHEDDKDYPTAPGIRIYGSLEVCSDPNDPSSCAPIKPPSNTADLKGQSGSSKLAKNTTLSSKLIKDTSELGKLSKNFVPTSSSPLIRGARGVKNVNKKREFSNKISIAKFFIPILYRSNFDYQREGIIRGASGFKSFFNKTRPVPLLRKEYISDLVFYNSSREYKQNLVPFRDYEGALELLLTSPLFNYQYKDDYPEKTRMGVIAEELPASLQLPTNPVEPDWVSIYGYLWAGIKALHKEFQDVKEQALKQCESDNPENKIRINPLKRKKQHLQEKIATYEKARDDFKAELSWHQQKEEELKKEIARLKKREELFKQELQNIKQQIQN